MRAVRADQPGLAVVVEESDGRARVRDPETGQEWTVPATDIEPIEPPGTEVPTATRYVLAAVDDRALALLLILDVEPRRVATLLETTDLCESDIHGVVGDLRAAGLVEPITVEGEPGYRTSPLASTGLEGLRSGGEEPG